MTKSINKAPARKAEAHEPEPPRTAEELIAKAKRMNTAAAKQQEDHSSQSAKELLAKFKAQQHPKKSTSKRGD